MSGFGLSVEGLDDLRAHGTVNALFSEALLKFRENDVVRCHLPGFSRSFTAIRKGAGLHCGSRLRSGEVFAYVGRNQNLKDLKDMPHISSRTIPEAVLMIRRNIASFHS